MPLNKCGILFRGYAKEQAVVAGVVERLERSVMRAREIGFGYITALVPKEKDCGETALILGLRLPCEAYENTFIVCPAGNENSDALNEGIELLRIRGISIAFVVSNKALGYLSAENARKMLVALGEGALVSGLAVSDDAVPETEDAHYAGILEGRLSNTFSAWNIEALGSVGNFDSKIGVEEIAPIVRLVRDWGPCLAPVFPTGQTGLDISVVRQRHHEAVMSTKENRQIEEARRAGGDFALIRSGILPGYPR